MLEKDFVSDKDDKKSEDVSDQADRDSVSHNSEHADYVDLAAINKGDFSKQEETKDDSEIGISPGNRQVIAKLD
jgi:hypothetical protein